MVGPARTLALLGSVALLCGCTKQLTYDHWETIQDGQSASEVEALLGKPTERLDMRWMYFDCDRCITADVYFSDCLVIGKTWSDPEHGMRGKSPLVNQPGDAETHTYRECK